VDEVIEELVSQYAEEAAFLWARRDLALHSGNYRLSDLAESDERLAAHIEGLHVSGVSGWRYCEEALATHAAGETFAAAVLALEACDKKRLKKVVDVVEAAPQAIRGLCSAFGWVNAATLKSTVSRLLLSERPLHRLIGVTACALHRVNPGFSSTRSLYDPDPVVRARLLRAVGELGAIKMLSLCRESLADPDEACRFWAAWTSVLLGDRDAGLEQLQTTFIEAGQQRSRALQLALQAMDVDAAHAWLRRVAAGEGNLRCLIQGSGIVGDPIYVPWLMSHMRDPKMARVAGVAFALITGANLEELQLVDAAPADFESGPTDDLDDTDLDMDPDFDLPWPSPEKTERWWKLNGQKFGRGTRFFVGAPVTLDHCLAVLRTGSQPQRILAAHHVGLLGPGTRVFNISAPAWRQQDLLAGTL
jgi:uncharacterized protein (TIGR02270 family)